MPQHSNHVHPIVYLPISCVNNSVTIPDEPSVLLIGQLPLHISVTSYSLQTDPCR